jgi:deoxyribodipyrimidine photo-lyase
MSFLHSSSLPFESLLSSSIVLLAFETLPISKHCLNCVLLIKTCLLSHPELRAQFIMESVADLRKNLQQRGLDLIVRRGKPEDVVPSIAKAIGAHTVFVHKETCSEETAVERGVQQGLHKLGEAQQKRVVLQFVWGSTLYHLDDLPFMPAELPDIYTQFRKVFLMLPHHLHHQDLMI